MFRVGKRFPEPTPRVAKAHIEVEMQSEEPAVRFRELQERVEDRCPVSTLFSDAGIHPEVVWVPNTLIRATGHLGNTQIDLAYHLVLQHFPPTAAQDDFTALQ